MVNIKEIKKLAKEYIDEKEQQAFVGMYVDLLETKKQTEKQLKKIEKSISQFESDPEGYYDRNKDLW